VYTLFIYNVVVLKVPINHNQPTLGFAYFISVQHYNDSVRNAVVCVCGLLRITFPVVFIVLVFPCMFLHVEQLLISLL